MAQPAEAPRLPPLSFMGAALVFLWAGGIIFLGQGFYEEPHYSVFLNSVHGIDTCRPALDPEFNLTFRVASHREDRSCVEPNMHVEVSYRGILLASSVATEEYIYVGRGKTVDWPVVARGAREVVPEGSVLDKFEVKLHGWDKKLTHRPGTMIYELRKRIVECWTCISCCPSS